MKKHISILLTLLCLAGWAHAQSFSGVWNPPTTQFGSTPNTNIEYRFTQTGDNLSGEIIHKKEGMKATVTGKLVNGVAAGTLNYDKHQFASLDQKFRLFTNPKDNTPTFMHESTKGAKVYGGKIFKNQTASKQLANQTQAVGSLQKGGFSAGSSAVVQQATASPKLGVAMAIIPKKTARDIGGYYRIVGLSDANGMKRNLFVNVRNFPDSKDRSKAYGEALILGNAYDIGSSDGRLFGYETNEDDVTVMFDPIYEQNIKNTTANGRIAIGSNGTFLVAPKLGYKMIKISQAEAERESKKLSATIKVRVDYKFIYVSGSYFWDKSVVNGMEGFWTGLDRALFGTGSIKATLEKSSGTVPVPSRGNLPERVFDIPQSRAVSSGFVRNYFESKNNLSWGQGSEGFGFYKFAKDSEIKLDANSGSTNAYIIPVNYKREFVVPRATLKGDTERLGIAINAHLTNKAKTGDVNFGNSNRKIFLHELNDLNKLTAAEKFLNRIIGTNQINNNPVYYMANTSKNSTTTSMVVFTVEVID
jgi:hypothetical protein